MRTLLGAWSLFGMLLYLPAPAAEKSDCLKFAVAADGAASLTNVCGDYLKVTYCVGNRNSARTCSQTPAVFDLPPDAIGAIPAYTADGAGRVFWAA